MLALNYCLVECVISLFSYEINIYYFMRIWLVDYDSTGSLRYAGKAQHYKLVFGVALNQC